MAGAADGSGGGIGGNRRTESTAGSEMAAATTSRILTAQRQPNSSVNRPVSGMKMTDEKPPVVTRTVIAAVCRLGNNRAAIGMVTL